MQKTENRSIAFAVFAAAFYALHAPLSKLLLHEIPPTMMAGFLYLGAGCGTALLIMIAGTYAVTRADSSAV